MKKQIKPEEDNPKKKISDDDRVDQMVKDMEDKPVEKEDKAPRGQSDPYHESYDDLKRESKNEKKPFKGLFGDSNKVHITISMDEDNERRRKI